MNSFYTDSKRLYEVVGEQADENYGLTGGFLRRTILRDCTDDKVYALDDVKMLFLEPVKAAA